MTARLLNASCMFSEIYAGSLTFPKTTQKTDFGNYLHSSFITFREGSLEIIFESSFPQCKVLTNKYFFVVLFSFSIEILLNPEYGDSVDLATVLIEPFELQTFY